MQQRQTRWGMMCVCVLLCHLARTRAWDVVVASSLGKEGECKQRLDFCCAEVPGRLGTADHIMQTEITQISDFKCQISNNRQARPIVMN